MTTCQIKIWICFSGSNVSFLDLVLSQWRPNPSLRDLARSLLREVKAMTMAISTTAAPAAAPSLETDLYTPLHMCSKTLCNFDTMTL